MQEPPNSSNIVNVLQIEAEKSLQIPTGTISHILTKTIETAYTPTCYLYLSNLHVLEKKINFKS